MFDRKPSADENERVAYRSTHPQVLEKWDSNLEALKAWRQGVQDFLDRESLGEREVQYNDLTGQLFIPYRDGGTLPRNWRVHKGAHLVPDCRSREGKELATRLQALRFPDPRSLPGMPSQGPAVGSGLWITPIIRKIGEAIYVSWSQPVRHPVDLNLWEQIKLSEYYRAIESSEEEGE
jgi:hypothetical protein